MIMKPNTVHCVNCDQTQSLNVVALCPDHTRLNAAGPKLVGALQRAYWALVAQDAGDYVDLSAEYIAIGDTLAAAGVKIDPPPYDDPGADRWEPVDTRVDVERYR